MKSKLTMTDRIAQFDWARTPVGSMSNWPVNLKSAVDICLANPLPMLVWWGPERINFYNDAYAMLIGTRHAGGLGVPARKAWAPVWSMFAGDVEAVALGGPAVLREGARLTMKRKGLPEEMFFNYTLSAIPDGNGGVGGVMQVAIDQTDRVLAERKRLEVQEHEEKRLREAHADVEVSLARWLAVVSNMAEGVILADAEGNLLDWNRAALGMHGYTRAEDARTHLTNIATDFILTAPDGNVIPFVEWPMSRLLRGETVQDLEANLRHHDTGIELDVFYNGTLIRDEAGNIRLALLSLHDVTEERRKQKVSRFSSHDGVGHPRIPETVEEKARRSAKESASAAETLLHHMNLTLGEREFCKHLGQALVEEALDAYLNTIRQNKGYDGSCIAASLAIALIIVHEL